MTGKPSSMHKFNVNVEQCKGAVVVGDHAKLTIGPTGKISEDTQLSLFVREVFDRCFDT